MDELNPYQSPESDPGPAPPKKAATLLYAGLLLTVPFLLCAGTLYVSTFFRLGIIHLLLISVVPLGLAISAAEFISKLFLPSPWHRVILIPYCIAIFVMWGWISNTFRLNPFP